MVHFGRVRDYWFRFEHQQRRRLHLHGVVWRERKNIIIIPEDVICATMPHEIDGFHPKFTAYLGVPTGCRSQGRQMQQQKQAQDEQALHSTCRPSCQPQCKGSNLQFITTVKTDNAAVPSTDSLHHSFNTSYRGTVQGVQHGASMLPRQVFQYWSWV